MAYGPTSTRLDFFIHDFQKLRPPCAVNQRLASVSDPGKVLVELVKYVGHLFLLAGASLLKEAGIINSLRLPRRKHRG